MNSIEQLIVASILGGTLLVPFVDWVAKDVVSEKITYIIAVATSILLGAFVAFAQHNFVIVSTDPNTWFVAALGVFAASQTVFNLYWRNSLIRKKWLFPGPDEEPPSQAGLLAQPGEEAPPNAQ